MDNIDYLQVGLKVGLEIHQQLETSSKLFCKCKPELSKEEAKILFLRRLRPTQSELGQIDPAALFEFQKGTKILYEADNETSCLVEMDEEPPHELNREAVETALIIALMLKAKPIDEVHIMRKTVIDGSNTTGFQRTCIVALNGEINVKGKRIPIQHIALEEDAARKTGEERPIIRYRIDRLCIPLVEVTTAPVIYTPKEAEEVALAIGQILRATKRAKRGLGTIRQDLNISIKDGALTEIKGVQELELVSTVVEYEVQRQLNLLKIRNELKKRGVKEEDLKEELKDVTKIFEKTKCRVIQEALKKGQRVIAVVLPKFGGLLKIELIPGVRLGTEMADHARFWGKVGGIFHTDEMPAYGISQNEITALRNLLKAGDEDAVVFVADTIENATEALKAVVERAKEALHHVPEETRAANPDGTTRYMRPRPGAARMYPETDVPPLRISEEYLEKLRKQLPELPEQKLERLMKEYGLNTKLATQIMDSEFVNLFETIVKESKVSPTFVAVVLTETLKALKREGIDTAKVSHEQLRRLFHIIGENVVAKEAIPDIISWLAKHEKATVEEAIEKLSLKRLSEKELEKTIDNLIAENETIIREKGTAAYGILIGLIMKKVRGRANAEAVSRILKSKLEKR